MNVKVLFYLVCHLPIISLKLGFFNAVTNHEILDCPMHVVLRTLMTVITVRNYLISKILRLEISFKPRMRRKYKVLNKLFFLSLGKTNAKHMIIFGNMEANAYILHVLSVGLA